MICFRHKDELIGQANPLVAFRHLDERKVFLNGPILFGKKTPNYILVNLYKCRKCGRTRWEQQKKFNTGDFRPWFRGGNLKDPQDHTPIAMRLIRESKVKYDDVQQGVARCKCGWKGLSKEATWIDGKVFSVPHCPKCGKEV